MHGVYANFFKEQFNVILDLLSLAFFIVGQGIFLSLPITIYLMITILGMILFALWYYCSMNQILEKLIKKRRKMLAATINNINQFKFIRIFNRQKEEIKQYQKLNKEYTQEDIRFIKLVLFYEIVNDHITYLKTPIIYLIGGISIMKGSMTFGMLTAFLLFSDKILDSFLTLGANLEVIDDFIVVRKRIQKLMKLKEEKENDKNYDLKGEIQFSQVSITFFKKSILENLNFEIKKGEKVAIIGENGSGKSILARAMMGFYPIKGDIFLNHYSIKKLSPSNIREYVELVSGDASLFAGTILQNITLGKKCKKEVLEKIVKQSEIYQDIQGFKDKYQTLIGEKGVKLSGGQKQRILIARALLRNKPIIIFDNAFNKLDVNTSQRILQNLIEKYTDTTMIFITHDLKIQEKMDKTIMIQRGTNKIKEGKNENKKEIKTNLSNI